ncbi:MAG: fimbria/pilus outer membrane usher protein, partial [Pseudomonadota bacterium]|nr:fimbria/pilus outer membrane usher protein [Pseudomonadota bacterium]
VALGTSRSFTANAAFGAGAGAPANELYANLVENAPTGLGYGYQLTAGTRGDYNADLQAQFLPADVRVEAARNHGLSGLNFGVRGAVTLLDGDIRMSRSVHGSFAVVDIGGVPNVPVYLDNQRVATTDASGRALIHDLHSYEDNRISVTPEELPLDAEITTGRLTLAPAYRSGIVARFHVRRIHGATFNLIRENGAPVPAGARVSLNGENFPVVRDGMTYVTTLDSAYSGEATWEGGSCRFEAPSPPAGIPQPDLGVLACR